MPGGSWRRRHRPPPKDPRAAAEGRYLADIIRERRIAQLGYQNAADPHEAAMWRAKLDALTFGAPK